MELRYLKTNHLRRMRRIRNSIFKGRLSSLSSFIFRRESQESSIEQDRRLRQEAEQRLNKKFGGEVVFEVRFRLSCVIHIILVLYILPVLILHSLTV